MGAAPAYRYPERMPERSPRVRVVPGGRPQNRPDTVSSSAIFLAKAFAVVLVVFALLGFVRIGLASATVTTALSADELSTNIDSARSEGNELEVRQSYLSNPTNVKQEAASKLGMSEPEQALTITLEADVVATDASGNLSLASSVEAASAQAATAQG
ncbi:cell division protein FtsL [Raoultibacter massiliensis]|uniref:Cell division protein FtsL n=1 Tax=Raoultibacter massiliensis TaxID=1852371 RepID=A0ABV1JDP6_9ACTN|nr:cell division protein FtsL [Raoultibacter massiliensis]